MFVTLSYTPGGASDDVRIEQKYPSDYGDDVVLAQIPKFAYPCKYER